MMIILVRHGEATHHTQRLTGGWTDSQLTEKGRAQIKAAAVKLAKDFAGRNCKLRILASDLQRASVSAQIIAEELGFKGEIEHCRFLREKNNGIAAGMTEEEMNVLPVGQYTIVPKGSDKGLSYANTESNNRVDIPVTVGGELNTFTIVYQTHKEDPYYLVFAGEDSMHVLAAGRISESQDHRQIGFCRQSTPEL